MAEGIVWQREQLYCWEKSMCLHPHPPAPPPSYLGVLCIPVEKWNSAMPSQGVATSPRGTSPRGRHRCLHTKPKSTPPFVFPPASISIILSSSPEIAELGRLLHTSASVASSSCCRHCGNSKRWRSILYGRRVVSLIAFMHWNCVDWDAEFVLTKLAVGIYEVKYEDLIWVNRIVRIWRGNLLTCTVCFLLAMEMFFFSLALVQTVWEPCRFEYKCSANYEGIFFCAGKGKSRISYFPRSACTSHVPNVLCFLQGKRIVRFLAYMQPGWIYWSVLPCFFIWVTSCTCVLEYIWLEFVRVFNLCHCVSMWCLIKVVLNL